MRKEFIKQKAEAKKAKELSLALERLMTQSLDFKHVFLEGYLKEEALKLVYQSGDPNLREESLAGLDAIYRFKKYLEHITLMGELAIEDLNEIEIIEDHYE